MVRIRFARHGCKARPFYHIVAADKQKARNGRFIEQLGTYDPAHPMTDATIKFDRFDYWLSVGAKATGSVSKVVREARKAAASTSA